MIGMRINLYCVAYDWTPCSYLVHHVQSSSTWLFWYSPPVVKLLLNVTTQVSTVQTAWSGHAVTCFTYGIQKCSLEHKTNPY